MWGGFDQLRRVFKWCCRIELEVVRDLSKALVLSSAELLPVGETSG